MKSSEIQHNVESIFDDFSKDEFIYDLLIAYGISKTSVTRLKKGDYNLSKIKGEILYKKKIFFKVEASDKLLSSIDEISKENRILKQNPRFVILTDYKHIVAKDLKLSKSLDIELEELPNYFDFFLPLTGSEVYNTKNDNEADRNASYKMASLYDLLIEENPKARKTLIQLGELNWKDINPDIFGSMTQAVVTSEYRSDLGMHYTSVTNILKLIKPLFLEKIIDLRPNE